MPELPEVETVRRLLRKVLQGRPIRSVEAEPDPIVLSGFPPEAFHEALLGRTVTDVGRRGKFFWLEFGEPPFVYGHLGMAGWVREVPPPGTTKDKEFRLREHGEAPLYDANGRPRFQKIAIQTDAARVAMTDSRRFARLWIGGRPAEDARVRKLGRDALDDLPAAVDLVAIFKNRKAPLKAALLDQGLFAGIGNWIADEVLYRARIAPGRPAATLSPAEVATLREAIGDVLRHACEVEADYERFPEDWLFHHRWGGTKGAEFIDGLPIVRETIGGRTTAWVPARQT
ncbi:MAG: hypothetical protein KIS66_10600 [Fimbriimonadaceae bacterium]|nr:hypothetical protein [Fimbriimonadaceae bacterium]